MSTDPMRDALEYAAEYLSSEWPERCQETVRRARAALASKPAEVEPQAQAVPAEPLRCDGCGKTIAEHDRMLRCQVPTLPQRQPLTDADALALCRQHLDRGLSHARPIVRATEAELLSLIRAVEALGPGAADGITGQSDKSGEKP